MFEIRQPELRDLSGCLSVGQGRAPIVLYTVWGVGTCVGCACSVFPKIIHFRDYVIRGL